MNLSTSRRGRGCEAQEGMGNFRFWRQRRRFEQCLAEGGETGRSLDRIPGVAEIAPVTRRAPKKGGRRIRETASSHPSINKRHGGPPPE